MPNSRHHIELAIQRALAAYLRSGLPEDVSVVRSLVSAPPEADRVTVLPGDAETEVVVPFLGNGLRAVRDETVRVRVWVECIGDDLEDVEDRAEAWTRVAEDVTAEQSTLGGVDGLVDFGSEATRMVHPIIELTPGFFYRWVELEMTADCRLD